MGTLLVLTTGQTDVQLVVNGNDGAARQEFDGKRCGLLHDEIEKRSWRVVDAPTQKCNQRASALPDGELALCTPKLDAVLRFFGDKPPCAALILETRRTIDSDPRFAGAVLERRLHDKNVSDVWRHAFLKDADSLEDRASDVDAVVRQEVVASLSAAVKKAMQDVQPKKIFVASTGGLAAANAVIEELVRLHAVGIGADIAAVQVLEVPDAALVNQVDRAVEEKFHPAAGYRARWQALSLIQNGNLLAAWGAVEHIKGEPGQQWTKVVERLAQFASSLPISDECSISVLKHPRMAVRAALRVEFALRAGDIPRAVHGTVAFFEAALWDHLNERVERSTNPERPRLYKIKEGQEPTDDRLLRKGDGSQEDRRRPFELRCTVDGIKWYRIHDDAGGPAARLAKYFLKREKLAAFDKALEQEIRELRNDVAHNEPTPELMARAREETTKADLWSRDGRFLTQKTVREVLEELGVEDPSNLYDNLIKQVRDALVR